MEEIKICCFIGNILKNLGKNDKSLKFYEKSLKIIENIYPYNKPFIAAVNFSNFGDIYQNLGDYAKALVNFETFLKIAKSILPEDDKRIAETYIIIGKISKKLCISKKALEYYKKSLQIFQDKLLQDNIPIAVNICIKISELNGYLAENIKALGNYEKNNQIVI